MSAIGEWLTVLSENGAAIADLMALFVVAVGTIEAFLRMLHLLVQPGDEHVRRAAWLRYARWLVAGLTFQLAADIIESAVAPSWDEIGRLAAIAAIRTFLNYFLERDVVEVRETDAPPRQAEAVIGQSAMSRKG